MEAAAVKKKKKIASVKPLNKSSFTKQTEFLWDTTKQN